MNTLIDLLKTRMEEDPDKAFLHIWDRQNKRDKYTYRDLYDGASQYARELKSMGLKKGDRVIILLLTKVEFFHAFFGVMLAGGIPVPMNPPMFILEWDDYYEKFQHIFNNVKPSLIICYDEILHTVTDKLLMENQKNVKVAIIEELNSHQEVSVAEKPVEIAKEEVAVACEVLDFDAKEEECAYIQFTSGTTELPKGAVLSHGALLRNMEAIGDKMQLTPADTVVTWLPLYHDMGLIGNFLTAIMWGVTVCIIPTEYFVMQPTNFFKVLTEFKATIICSPNMGYVICNKYVKHKRMDEVDLSNLRISLVGADHIEFNDMMEFDEKFNKYKAKEDIFVPTYGFAESCLAVGFCDVDTPLQLEYVDKVKLSTTGKVRTIEKESKDTYKVMAVGKALKGQEIRIIDEDGNTLPDDTLGEICVKGNMMMNEYYEMKEKTEEIVKDGWFRTSDYGYMRDGMLFYFDRKKDVVKKNGIIYRPKDFENYCADISEIKRGRSAVISVDPKGTGKEELSLMIETGTLYEEKYIEIIERLNEIYLEHIGEIPDTVYVIARGSILQTSNGKFQRYKCKDKLLNGTLDIFFHYDNIAKKTIYCK